MEDPQRAPGDGDRAPIRARIQRATSEGRLSPIDAEIRLANLAAAQSLTELSLMTRDLDQLDAATMPLVRTTAAPPSAIAESSYSAPLEVTETSGSRAAWLILGTVLALLLVGGTALYLIGSDGQENEIGELPRSAPSQWAAPSGSPSGPGGQATSDAGQDPAAKPFRLSSTGVKSFVKVYRDRFATTKVTDLVMYGDYVVVQVPVPGKHRHSGWLYRDGAWTDFGGVGTDFPGAATVDLRQLDVAALMRNVAKARRTLAVEDFSLTYVAIHFRPDYDDVPNVNIYVSNEYGESGYLATNLRGGIERAYPFAG